MQSEQRQGAAGPTVALFVLLAGLTAAAAFWAASVQQGFGRIAVSNETFFNANGVRVRAKLLKPIAAADRRLPGVVYVHGYQNNRESGDAYSIELARRGFVVLAIDAIGRGNSGIPGDPATPGFDTTYGSRAAFAHLKRLPFVDPQAVGMLGHSLGAEMAYRVALDDPTVAALVITGFAYTLEATFDRPRNLLMIIGRFDEFRDRMTGTRDIRREWMSSPQTRRVIPVPAPRLDTTYGSFAQGTARRVYVPNAVHVQEAHHHGAIAETLVWLRQALNPPDDLWLPADDQIWPLKEGATLIAMLACFAALLPLTGLLLRIPSFADLRATPSPRYACPRRSAWRYATVNGALMWLYLPLIFVLFGLHRYVVRIDRIFPMMLTNGIVWWFVCINLGGFLLFRRWYRRTAHPRGVTLADLGLSWQAERFALPAGALARTALLAGLLFAFACGAQYLLERAWLVDFRFVFPFASDLTPYRAGLFAVYFPWLLVAFLQTGAFLHGQLRPAAGATRWRTFLRWSLFNTAVLVVPLMLLLLVQYLPLFTTGVIPLVGPGGMCVSFLINLVHVIGVLVIVTPLSTGCFQLTGRIYLGALLNAAIVTWMFASSQVVAPIPV